MSGSSNPGLASAAQNILITLGQVVKALNGLSVVAPAVGPTRNIVAADTLMATDVNGTVWASLSGAANITVPLGLPAGYVARLVWFAGAGKPTFVGASGVTLTSVSGAFGVSALHGQIVIRQTPTANTFLIDGATG